jgi:hypothetical protein
MIPVPVFSAEPNEEHTERVFLKPPRASESLAGTYPFVVKVRSLSTGEARTIQGVLEVNPFHHITMDVLPKKGFVSPFRRQNTFDITLMNLGNVIENVQMTASDPEDDCTYDFEQNQLPLDPGQQKVASFDAQPTTTRFISSSRLIGFTVTGRSVDTPGVVASTQGQIEQRPFFSPMTLIIAVLLGLLFGLWLWAMPKPPSLVFSTSQQKAILGTTIEVNWRALHADKVKIVALLPGEPGIPIYEGPELVGKTNFSAEKSGDYRLFAEATKEGKRASESITITIVEPPKVPQPEILQMSAEPTQVKLGQPFELRYKFNDAVTKAVLGPLGQDLDRSLDRIEITPNRLGSIEYTIVASNAQDIKVRKTVTVNVVDQSDAIILAFDATPPLLKPEDTKVTVSWQVNGADRVELVGANGETILVEPTGSREFNVFGKTIFTLTAMDKKARKVVRKLTVTVQAPIKGPDPNDPPGGDPTSSPRIGGGVGPGTGTGTGGR